MDTNRGVKDNRSRWTVIAIAVFKFAVVLAILEILQIMALSYVLPDFHFFPQLRHVIGNYFFWIWFAFVILFAWRWKSRIFWMGLVMAILSCLPGYIYDQMHLARELRFGPHSDYFWGNYQARFWNEVHWWPALILMSTGLLAFIIELFRLKKKPPFATFSPGPARNLLKPLSFFILSFPSLILGIDGGLRSGEVSNPNYLSIPASMVYFEGVKPRVVTWNRRPYRAIIWDFEAGEKLFTTTGPGRGFKANSGLPAINGSILAEESSSDHHIYFADLKSGSVIKSEKAAPYIGVVPGIRNEFWSFGERILRRWNGLSGKIISEHELPENSPEIRDLAVSSDGKRLLIYHYNGVRTVDATTADLIRSIDFKYQGLRSSPGFLSWNSESHDLSLVFLMEVGPNYQPFIFQLFEIDAQIWDMEKGSSIGSIRAPNRFFLRPVFGMQRFNPPMIKASAFSPDKTMFLTCSEDGAARIYDVKSQKMLHEFTTTPAIYLISGAFSPDSTKVLAGSSNGNVFLWDIESGDLIMRRSFWKDYKAGR